MEDEKKNESSNEPKQRYFIEEVENGFILTDCMDSTKYVAVGSDGLALLLRELIKHYGTP